ncbi:hypothetical protein [Variovorax sp. OV700]|uniref:hypothetical protein n=1 Tax=Variovorax sp. OV700 TaxID=1882826 RepID=UPI001113B998|nr:hypothetical protein [Variovorax sp. OV700]
MARLLEPLCVAISWFALILAAPIFVIACFDATHLTHRISPSDQDHIEVVSRYARTFIDQNKRLPDHDEYQNWVVATDQQQGTCLDGRLGEAWLEGVAFAGLLAIAVFFRWAASVKRRSPQFE